MDKIPFSQLFPMNQTSIINAHSEERVFYGEISEGYVGFLGAIASNDFEGVKWSWYIDGECVEKDIEHALGDMAKPSIFNPPYLVNKSIEIKAKNENNAEVQLDTLCIGICCLLPTEKIPAMQPFEPVATILTEIKKEIQDQVPEGEALDKSVSVTSAITEVYDTDYEAQKGLNWMSCSIFNKGDDDVYVSVNKWKWPEAPLSVGQTMNFDFSKKKAIKKIFLKCDAGKTATITIHAMK
jgi:hypothetical protein